jgi:hypothetical protein
MLSASIAEGAAAAPHPAAQQVTEETKRGIAKLTECLHSLFLTTPGSGTYTSGDLT